MATLLNNLQVNVLDSNYNAYLQYYDNNLSLVNTEAEGLYFNKDMSYTFANCKNMYMNMDDTWYGYYAKVENMSHTYYECQNIRGSVTVRQNVTNANAMCYNCFRLDGTVQLGPNVVDFNRMYQRCTNVTGLNIKTQNAAHIYNKLFAEYDANNTNNTLNKTSILNMRNIYFGPQVVNAEFAFDNCYTYKGYVPKMGASVINAKNCFRNVNLMLGSPDTGDSVVDAYGMFANCQNLSGDARVGNNVINAAFVFNYCVNLSGNVWFSNSVQNYAYACNNCPNIRGSITIGRNAVNLYNAFMNLNLAIGQLKAPDRLPNLINCVNAFNNDVYLTGNVFNTMSVSNGFQTFRNCMGLQGDARVGQNLQNAAWMFYHVNIDSVNYGPNFGKNLINAYDMFGYPQKNAEKMIRGKAVMPYINANAQNYAEMYAGSNFQEIDSTIVAQNYNNINKVNMYYMFYNLQKAQGSAYVPNASNVVNMYGNCFSINQVYYDRWNCSSTNNFYYVFCAGNTSSYNKFNQIKNIYVSDNCHNFYAAISYTYGGYQNFLNGAQIRIKDGYSMNNVENIQYAFYGCNKLLGTAYIPKNAYRMYKAYRNCFNINKLNYSSSKSFNCYLNDQQQNVLGVFGNCINAEQIYYDMGNVNSIQYFFGAAFKCDEFTNTINYNNFPNYPKLKQIKIGPNVKNLYYTFRGATPYNYYNTTNNANVWQRSTYYVNNRLSASPKITGGQNVVNMVFAFSQQFNISSAICGDKVTNAASAYSWCHMAPIQRPIVGNNVIDSSSMYYYCTGMGKNMNDNDIIPLRKNLTKIRCMYQYCNNMHGTIDLENFLLLNVGSNNCDSMFFDTRNISLNSSYVVPQGSGYYLNNMYYNSPQLRNLYIAGTPAAFFFVRDLHYNDALATPYGNNIKNIYVMNTCNWNTQTSFSFVNGVQNLYVNCNNANFMLCNSGTSGQEGYASYYNLKNIQFGNYANNVAYFMSGLNSIGNIRKITFTNKIQNMCNFANNCRNLGNHGQQFDFQLSPNANNMCNAFANCYQLKLNLDNAKVNQCEKVYNWNYAFYNCKNITGHPYISPIAQTAHGGYSNCYNIYGDAVTGNNLNIAYELYWGCNNLNGNVYVQNKVTNIRGMCSACGNISGTAYIGSNIRNCQFAFNGCTNLNHVVFNSMATFNTTASAYQFQNMFSNCHNMKFTLDGNNFPLLYRFNNNSCKTNFTNMFWNCTNLTGYAVIPAVSYYKNDASGLSTYATNMYYNCQNINKMYYMRPAAGTLNNLHVVFGGSAGAAVYNYFNKIEQLVIAQKWCADTGYFDGNNIQNRIFAYCKNLKNLTFEGTFMATAGMRMFSDQGCNYYLGNETGSSYTYSGVNNFNGVNILINARNCDGILRNLPASSTANITIGNYVERLRNAFSDSKWKGNLKLPAKLQIASGMCMHCPNIDLDFTDAKNLVNIDYIIYDGNCLSNIYIPKTVYNAYYAFCHCKPGNITWQNRNTSNIVVGALYNSFANCKNLNLGGNLYNFAFNSYPMNNVDTFKSVKNIDISKANHLFSAFGPNTANTSATNYYIFSNPSVTYNLQCSNINGLFFKACGMNQNMNVDWNVAWNDMNYAFCVNNGNSNIQFSGNIRFSSTTINLYRALPKRISTSPRLNMFIKKKSTLDNMCSNYFGTTSLQWFCDGLITSTTSTSSTGAGSLIDNGFYFPSVNIYVYNNYA